MCENVKKKKLSDMRGDPKIADGGRRRSEGDMAAGPGA